MLSKQLVQAAAGNAGGGALGIEDVFSTYLYTGNDSTQTITNGIDLAGEGGLVWIKCRSATGGPYTLNHILSDTARGIRKALYTNATDAQSSSTNFGVSAYNSDGFSLNGSFVVDNSSVGNYASWTFRKAEKFFDVVTYTGDGVAGRTISHNLGSVPGCIIVKRLNGADNWTVQHRSLGATKSLYLNLTNSEDTSSTEWANTNPTASVFTVGTSGKTNANGDTYVAYLFAHDAGGFGDDGTESVIKCGSYAGSSGTVTVDLGWEPQWVLIKKTNASSDWQLEDNMRGMAMDTTEIISPNLANAAEAKSYSDVQPRPTGFTVPLANGYTNGAGSSFIYIAIRRGPMKTPENATEVFDIETKDGSTSLPAYKTGFPVDVVLRRNNIDVQDSPDMVNRITGSLLYPNTSDAEVSSSTISADFAFNNGFDDSTGTDGNDYGYLFRRAPGFFDVVTYTGTGSVTTVSHNLGVEPELMIIKRRNGVAIWQVYHSSQGNTKYAPSFRTDPFYTSSSRWNNTSPTSTQFTLGTDNTVNGLTYTYIAYLFATVPNVSKVGGYTGTGTTLSIDCGFTAGARFVLIKRADVETQSPAEDRTDWYVWDTTRGIVSGNDPYWVMNGNPNPAQITSTDYIDPLSTGFQISSSAPAAINANGGSYIFLAIA